MYDEDDQDGNSHLSPLPALAYLLTICFFGGCFEGFPNHNNDDDDDDDTNIVVIMILLMIKTV